MDLKPLVCPFCRGEIRLEKRASRPFACHSCGRLLTISPLYFWIPLLLGIPIGSLFGYAFGIRDTALVVFAVVLWFPVTTFIGVILMLCFRPKVRPHQSDLDLQIKR